MATGHILPGYGDPISRMKRVQAVGYPIEYEKLLEIRQKTSLDKNEFEMIRSRARSIWSRPDREKTTYNFHYNGEAIGSLVPTRPASATRKNNPHPPLIFLTNRLHHIPGYSKPDTTVHTHAYKVDGSEGLKMVENQARHLTRSKYTSRPSTASFNQYKDPYHLKEFMEPTPAQATEAWLQQARNEEKQEALKILENQRFQYENEKMFGTGMTPRAATAIPSTYRWMKMAGPHETSRLNGIHHPEHIPRSPTLPNPMEVLGLRRSIHQPTKRPQLRFNSARGDYSIHPDWPPSIPHHSVP